MLATGKSSDSGNFRLLFLAADIIFLRCRTEGELRSGERAGKQAFLIYCLAQSDARGSCSHYAHPTNQPNVFDIDQRKQLWLIEWLQPAFKGYPEGHRGYDSDHGAQSLYVCQA
jgi:hypothetical protein